MQSKTSGLTELKNRVLYVIAIIIVFRIGAHIPVPAVDPIKLADFFSAQSDTIFGLFNMFSGGALERFTVFALGIMPYISASIIMQMLTAVSPSLETLKKEGEQGRRKINQYTRNLTLVIATVQAIGFAKFMFGQNLALFGGLQFYVVVVVTLVSGTMLLMWLGEQVTEKGIGNGISIIIFAGIVAGLPVSAGTIIENVRNGDLLPLALIIIGVMLLLIIAFIVFIERGQRRLTVNYARRQQGRRMYQAQSTHLPLKINMAGVIPPIFASTIILLPATLSSFFSIGDENGILQKISLALSPGQPLYLIALFIGIIFFAFFYTALVYNPKDTADNLKKSGAFLTGIRPGEKTAQYIDGVMTRLTLVGGLYVAFVALLPEVLLLGWQVPVYFGGTSLLIVVVVVMDFMAQVQTHLMSAQYETLLKKSKRGKSGNSQPGLLR